MYTLRPQRPFSKILFW